MIDEIHIAIKKPFRGIDCQNYTSISVPAFNSYIQIAHFFKEKQISRQNSYIKKK